MHQRFQLQRLINGPHNIVISGQREAVNLVCTAMKAEGVKIQKLTVSHAFHSPLMKPMLAAFEQVVRAVHFHPPQLKLISNVTGEIVTNEVTTPEYWCDHLQQPVQFAASIASLKRQGVALFVEIGPKPILLGMARQCLGEHYGIMLPSLRPRATNWQQLLTSLGELYVQGISVDWLGFDRDFNRRREHLPTYPFQRQRYWITTKASIQASQSNLPHSKLEPEPHPLLGQPLLLAGTKEIRFQSTISQHWPQFAYLADHRLLSQPLFPLTAYLEMALAAGKTVFQSEQVLLKEVFIEQPLVLALEEAQLDTLQLVLIPNEENNAYAFQIFSLISSQPNHCQAAWMRHATGQVLLLPPGSEEHYQPKHVRVDLAALQAECTATISPITFYSQLRERGIDYGASFQAVAQLWRGNSKVLGQIRAPAALAEQLENYQLHPALLDACLHILGVILPDETYMPIILDFMRAYRRPGSTLWSYATLADKNDSKGETLTAELHLFDDSGKLIVVISGLVIRRVTPTHWQRHTSSLENHLYEVVWQPQILVSSPSVHKQPSNWLIFAAESNRVGNQITQQLFSSGHRCIWVSPGSTYQQLETGHYQLNPSAPEEFQQLLQEIKSLENDDSTLNGIVHLWSLETDDWEVNSLNPTSENPVEFSQLALVREGQIGKISLSKDSQLLGWGSVLHLVQALVKTGLSSCLWLVTRGAQPVATPMSLQVQQAPVWGLAKAIALEHPELHSVCVDLDPLAEAEQTSSALSNELLSSSGENQIAYRQGIRYVARLQKKWPVTVATNSKASITKFQPCSHNFCESQPYIREDSSYLITGMGALGLKVASWLVEQGAGNLVLTSRRGISSATAQEAVTQLEKAGATVRVISADISERQDVARLLAEC